MDRIAVRERLLPNAGSHVAIMDALKWLLELDPSALCVALLVATLAGVWLYVMSTKPRPPSPEVLSLLTDTKGLPLGKRLNPKGKSKAKQVRVSVCTFIVRLVV